MRPRGEGVIRATLLLSLALGSGCRDPQTGRDETGLEALAMNDVHPKVVVPGTRMLIEGRSFLAQPLGISWLRLVGNYGGTPIDVLLPTQFVDFEHMELSATQSVLAVLGPNASNFAGRANVEVDFVPDGTRHASVAQSLQLTIVDHLDPVLQSVDAASTIYVNEPMEVVGSGLLLGGDEGTTVAVVEGCFTPAGGDSCSPVATVEVPLAPTSPFDREHAIFAFSPQIAGIEAGHFEGTVTLRNEHADGEVRTSEAVSVVHDLAETVVAQVGDGGEARGSLGRYVPVLGNGFVSPDDGGLTSLVLDGAYFPDAGGEAPVTGLQVIPEFVDGRTVRYVVNEEDALAQAVDIRLAQGTFVGQLHAITEYGSQRVEGAPIEATLRLEPVRQVVYVQFNPTYVESLRLFGVRALDQQIRARVFEVLARDFEAINVEFREQPPTDYKLFSTVEIAGPDPNGLGLLGYDNTPGKDVNNQRLDDTIGGVNATTLEDGLPGFGGVFMESLFTFSEHPPAGTVPSGDVATFTFDEVFDPFRPDRGGRAVSSVDFAGAGIPTFTEGSMCPATERPTQLGCAVFVLGSVVGSTVSHEIGHSLGLADPLGSPDTFHNNGDLPGRLMDSGAQRSFEERAELYGQGPSRFCVEAYEYMRDILPTNDLDPPVSRPPC